MAKLRLTDAEKAAIRQRAAQAGMSERQWVAQAVQDYKRKRKGEPK